MQKTDRFSRDLNRLAAGQDLRAIPGIDYGADLYLELNGQKLLNLASNNYLGLSGTETLKQASIRAVEKYGTSGSASRLITGNYHIYNELETTLARFKKQEKALVAGSGYAANLCILGALAGRDTLVFSDRLNHASIIDATVLSRSRQVRYRHTDMDHLGYLLTKHREHPAKILVTDSVFSMDGDRAPLEEIVGLCKKNKVLVVVDESHATGILGQGRGLAHELGLEKEIDVHMGTFSKALGSYGGYIASSRTIIDLIINRGRAFIYSTALPPAAVGASLAALDEIISRPPGNSLINMAGNMKGFLDEAGFDTGQSSTQIIPVILKDSPIVIKAQQKLVTMGLFAGAVRPPTVPAGSARLRLSLRADMSDQDLNLTRQAFASLAQNPLSDP
ncbi:aminotransferase class I/II-fold pyridoxal phosphate-dependent enzyme [Desulfonatronovibrio hydrogenovorans]|uniref:aminotransferase class I/II-fold pyridoxal phosphate-dependent enzyme n=1 Tax=Desulfonatronovibrio hydrogenovorans TaxID=53245 RepID=UPI000691F8AC|nr:8-amino-7-oxononanoate synthase [Desulfonatronovibrio hydrogenovorans]